MPQNIFFMIIEQHILIIWNMFYRSSCTSPSPSDQVLRQQIRGGGGGSRLVLTMLTQGGGSKISKKIANVILEQSLSNVILRYKNTC